MNLRNWQISAGLVAALGCATPGSAQGVKRATPEALKSRLAAMQPAKHVWKEITWKTCLLEGLQEAKKSNKPVLLWVFIHNPNEERC